MTSTPGIDKKFELLCHRYTQEDERAKRLHDKPFFDTEKGIWGASSMLDVFAIFTRMGLDERKAFVDLGCGDGRIALLAALFVESVGVEYDKALCETAERIRRELLPSVPELARCRFVWGDYVSMDLSHYDTLFMYADHPFDAAFERKLLRECAGVLLCYNKIFLPKILKKGPTVWNQQVPVVTYPLGAGARV
jgi:SAM-dependent methyltransferase